MKSLIRRACRAGLLTLAVLALAGLAACDSEGTSAVDTGAADVVADVGADVTPQDVALPGDAADVPAPTDVSLDVPADAPAPLDVAPADAPGDAPAPTDVAPLDVPADAPPPQPYACGSSGLMCQPGEACAATGQGACGGSPPGPDGCGPDCHATECGGGTYCLCDWFECVALPAGCETCGGCQLPASHSFCMCEDVDGHVRLSCPGA